VAVIQRKEEVILALLHLQEVIPALLHLQEVIPALLHLLEGILDLLHNLVVIQVQLHDQLVDIQDQPHLPVAILVRQAQHLPEVIQVMVLHSRVPPWTHRCNNGSMLSIQIDPVKYLPLNFKRPW